MFYYLFDYINKVFNPPGFDVFRYLSFRSALSAITALLISFYFGPKIIARLKKNQVDQPIREEGPQTHLKKAGTPTMGGLIILISVVIPVLIWSDINSIYIILVLFGTVFLGAVGFLDDYLKVVKKLPKGLIARYKLMGQI
ncbi:MAG: phospho-N-acetylmuramoyl-pentapeptide-transferase, partial [Melioribacteraceae bacterium]